MRIIGTSRFKTAGLLVLISVGALLLAGCNTGGAGIFYTLNKATAQTTTVIGDSRTVASMTQVGGSTGVYYAAAGTVYTASVGSSPSWSKVSPPSSASSDICTSITSNGSTLYAVYYDPNADSSTSYYLYSATVSTTSPDTSPSWSTVSGFDSNSSFTVQKVYSVNGNVLVMTMDNTPSNGSSTGLYSLYQVSNPSTPILSGLQDPPSAGAWDGTDFWFIGGYSAAGSSGGATLYSGTTLTSLSQVSSQPSLATGQVFRDIYYSSLTSTLFVTTSLVTNSNTSVSGGVYAYQGGSWTSNSIISWPSGVTPTGLDGLDEYEASSSSDVILVGADYGGYYEINLGDPTSFSASSASGSPITLGQPGNTTTTTAGADYVSTTLASAHVIGFFNDVGAGSTSTPDRVFALTQSGLWLNQSSSGQRTWTLQ